MTSQARARLRMTLRLGCLALLGPLSGLEVRGETLRHHLFHGVIGRLAGNDGQLHHLLRYVFTSLYATWSVAFVVGLVALAVGGVVRHVARARVRARHPDPLSQVRRAVERHPRAVAVVAWLPAVVWSGLLAAVGLSTGEEIPLGLTLPLVALPTGISLLTFGLLARRGVRALVAPTLAEGEHASLAEDAEGFHFDAVAITPQTLGAVATMASFGVLAIALLMTDRGLALVRDTGPLVWLAGYAAVALGGAALFARRSKIAIGLDGVLVGGTTRERFYAFRDVERVTVAGDTIELRRRARVVLRLQLHGPDAGRRDAIVERLAAAVARAHAGLRDPAAAFVEAASVAELTRAADGAASYRFTTPTREKLWEIFESPALATEARRAAAEALVAGLVATEAPRFRVAAERIAEPVTRRRLEALVPVEVGADTDEDVGASARRRAAWPSDPFNPGS